MFRISEGRGGGGGEGESTVVGVLSSLVHGTSYLGLAMDWISVE